MSYSDITWGESRANLNDCIFNNFLGDQNFKIWAFIVSKFLIFYLFNRNYVCVATCVLRCRSPNFFHVSLSTCNCLKTKVWVRVTSVYI